MWYIMQLFSFHDSRQFSKARFIFHFVIETKIRRILLLFSFFFMNSTAIRNSALFFIISTLFLLLSMMEESKYFLCIRFLYWIYVLKIVANFVYYRSLERWMHIVFWFYFAINFFWMCTTIYEYREGILIASCLMDLYKNIGIRCT